MRGCAGCHFNLRNVEFNDNEGCGDYAGGREGRDDSIDVKKPDWNGGDHLNLVLESDLLSSLHCVIRHYRLQRGRIKTIYNAEVRLTLPASSVATAENWLPFFSLPINLNAQLPAASVIEVPMTDPS